MMANHLAAVLEAGKPKKCASLAFASKIGNNRSFNAVRLSKARAKLCLEREDL
jgi:hypothetical protein